MVEVGRHVRVVLTHVERSSDLLSREGPIA